jgi:hypothetical protein
MIPRDLGFPNALVDVLVVTEADKGMNENVEVRRQAPMS